MRFQQAFIQLLCQLGDVWLFNQIEVSPRNCAQIDPAASERLPTLNHIEFRAQILAGPKQRYLAVKDFWSMVTRGHPIELFDVA
jgi:hypothetical protein